MLKKIPSDKTNGAKIPSFFWRAPTHHSFTFDFWILYELKYKGRLFKSMCGIFQF